MSREIVEYIPKGGWREHYRRIQRRKKVCEFITVTALFAVATYFVFFYEALP